MNTLNPPNPPSPKTRGQLFREWTASFAVLGLLLGGIYVGFRYLRTGSLEEVLGVALALVVAVPLGGFLVGVVCRANYALLDHVRLACLLTGIPLGREVGQMLVWAGHWDWSEFAAGVTGSAVGGVAACLIYYAATRRCRTEQPE